MPQRQPPSRALAGRRRAAGVVVACAAHFLVGADGLAVAIALPTVQADLDVAPIDGQWVLTAFGIAFGGTLLLGGRLGDLYGRRRLLVCGMALFAIGSLVAGAAPVLAVLAGGRLLQGFGAAAAVPAALALIGGLTAPGPARTRALSLMAAMASVGVISGLLIGGLVTELLGWRWVFLLMAAPAAVAALAALRVLPEARAESAPRRPDAPGAALLTLGVMALLLAVTGVERAGVGAAATILPLSAGLGLLAAFAAWERRARAPLVRFGILGIRSLRAASLGIGLNAAAFTAIVYVGTLYLQGPLGYEPLEAGLALLPVDAVAFVVPLLCAHAIARRSPRALLAASFACTALALLWLARAPVPADYATDVLAPLVVLGASLSIAFVVLNQEAIADVEHDERGLASGIFETSNHLFGGAIGVALYATVLAAAASSSGDAAGHRAAFLVAAAVGALGVAAAVAADGRRDR